MFGKWKSEAKSLRERMDAIQQQQTKQAVLMVRLAEQLQALSKTDIAALNAIQGTLDVLAPHSQKESK